MEDRDKAKHIFQALNGFITASGKFFNEAGAHNEAFYRSKAREAVNWWREEGRKAFDAESER